VTFFFDVFILFTHATGNISTTIKFLRPFFLN